MKRVQLFLASVLVTLFGLLPMQALAADSNLISNPSLETATAGKPTDWTTNSWGTNKAQFVYETTGHTGTRSATVTLSNYTSGDAKWKFAPVTVTPGATYTFSDWYKGNVKSSIDAVVVSTTGATTYVFKGDFAASADWKQASFTYKVPANAKTLTFHHYIKANGSLTVDDYSLTAPGSTPPTTPAPTAPTVSVTAPAANATVANTVAVTATASGAQPIQSVQFKLDGASLGAADTTAPYSVDWDTKAAANGVHTLSAVVTDTSNLTATASNVSVTVSNVTATAPVVALTSPAPNATLTATQTISATASSNSPITSLQFKVDGANLGSALTAAPYVYNWDTTTIANGSHAVSVSATNAAGQTTTTAPVTITTTNTTTPPTTPPTPPTTPPSTGANLIANPSVETANGATPANWFSGGWGTNTTTFSYQATGHTGSRSLKADVTAYTNGDAKWAFTNVNITAGKTYQYSNWYQSNVDTELDAAVTLANGTVQYHYLATAPASTAWNKVSAQFTAPANAVSMTVFQAVAKKGYVVSDDFSLTEYTPSGFNRAIVSLTFDDGWRSQYTNALPILDAHNVDATFYLLTSTVTYPDYMTVAQMETLKAHGHELDSHTITHPHLPTLGLAQLQQELGTSQTQLRTWFGASVADDFASPYGEYNATTLAEIKKLYRSHRSTDVGFNSKDSFDIYNIKVQNILYTTTAAQVQAWVDQAQRDHTWLVLVYHEVATALEDPTYSISPADLDAQISAIQARGASIQTIGSALNEILPQL